MATSPFKKPNIEYKPQVGESTPAAEVSIGEDGGPLKVAHVIEAIDFLDAELDAAVAAIETRLSDFAITDINGTITASAARVLGTVDIPSSVSYETYVNLAAREGGETVRDVFEEKAFSVWGDASLALVTAMHSVASEAARARAFLVDGCQDDKIVEALSEWVASARDFTVDAKLIGKAGPTEDLIEEIGQYRKEAAEVQKAAIIGSNRVSADVRGNLRRISTMYSSNMSIYDSMVDVSTKVEPRTSGVVASVIDRHMDDIDEYKTAKVEDLMFRTEAFTEATSDLIKSVAELKMSQMINIELAKNGGVAEAEIEPVTTTLPDRSFDSTVTKETSTSVGSSGSSPLSLEVTRALIEEEILADNNANPITYEWHSKDIHDSMGIVAANSLLLNGKADTAFSLTAHDHNSAYAALMHTHAYVGTADHTKAAHDALLINADTLDTKHATDFIGIPTSLPASTNLNNITTPGMYYCPSNATVATMTNVPTSGMAFSLLVEQHAGRKQIVTSYLTPDPSTWVRNLYDTTWGSWKKIQYTDTVDAHIASVDDHVDFILSSMAPGVDKAWASTPVAAMVMNTTINIPTAGTWMFFVQTAIGLTIGDTTVGAFLKIGSTVISSTSYADLDANVATGKTLFMPVTLVGSSYLSTGNKQLDLFFDPAASGTTRCYTANVFCLRVSS